MKLIKINAIDSTNNFLKDLASNQYLEDYTTVVTNNQTNGRGQMNNSWVSEPEKNLTFSVFTCLKGVKSEHQPYLNFAVSLAIIDILIEQNIPNIAIKWPNDIMAGNKKICGVLIESTLIGNNLKNVIIGIGLNVNQTQFPKQLPNASSLKNITMKNFSLDGLLDQFLLKLKEKISWVEEGKLEHLSKLYHNHLYMLNTPTTFKNNKSNKLFMGIIKEVNPQGKLIIEQEDESLLDFNIKEISFAKF